MEAHHLGSDDSDALAAWQLRAAEVRMRTFHQEQHLPYQTLVLSCLIVASHL
jgi:hypothetical protein